MPNGVFAFVISTCEMAGSGNAPIQLVQVGQEETNNAINPNANDSLPTLRDENIGFIVSVDGALKQDVRTGSIHFNQHFIGSMINHTGAANLTKSGQSLNQF